MTGAAGDGAPFETFSDFYQSSAYAAFPQEHRRGGTFGLGMIDVRQEAIEIVDPAMPEISFASCIASSGDGEFDFGDGWRRGRLRPGVVDVQPAFQDCGLRIPAMHIRSVFLQKSVLDRRLEEVGVAPSALDAVTGAFRLLPDAAAQVDALWAALRSAGPAASLAVDGAFLGLLGAMLRAAGDERLDVPVPLVGDRRLARVLDYVEAHIDQPLTAGELAGVACVSVFHFGRVFRAALGETPHRYVMGRRVERAKAMLLAEPHLDLTAVALATGFASHSHLTEVFRARVGAPPGAWRREMAS